MIDLVGRRLTKGGEPVELPPKEFELLARFAASPGQVHSRADLLRDVWGSSPDWQDPGTITVHIRRLRRKIEDDPAQPAWDLRQRVVGPAPLRHHHQDCHRDGDDRDPHVHLQGTQVGYRWSKVRV